MTAATTATTTFLTDADLDQLGDWPDLVAAIRAAYARPAGEGAIPPRTMARADGGWLRALSGAPAGSPHMGAKLIAASVRNSRASYLMALFDRETTQLVALIDANRITAGRTAATSAVAADLLAPQRPLRVAVIGSGLEARHHIFALGAIRELQSVVISSPTQANRERLAARVGDGLGVPAAAAADAASATAGADVVIAAARSRDEAPTLKGAWLDPGVTVISIGSTLPEQHEVDVEVIRRAARIFADVPGEVAGETGDLLDASAAGVEFGDRLHSLEQLVSGTVPGRRRDDEILLYKSVGSALQDLAVAEFYLARARELGVGTPLPVTVAPVRK